MTAEKEEGSERSVLAAVQLRTEGKGARRLFDCDSSSHCKSQCVMTKLSVGSISTIIIQKSY